MLLLNIHAFAPLLTILFFLTALPNEEQQQKFSCNFLLYSLFIPTYVFTVKNSIKSNWLERRKSKIIRNDKRLCSIGSL